MRINVRFTGRIVAIAILLWFNGGEDILAQKIHREFGIVTPGDFRSEHPDAQTALVLYDFGMVSFDRAMRPVYLHHRVVRLLDDDPQNAFLTHKIVFGRDDELSSVRARVHQQAESGQISMAELTQNVNINSMRDGSREAIIAFSRGSGDTILEFETILVTTDDMFLREWRFQSTEPTLYTEFQAMIPDTRQYSITPLNSGEVRFGEVRPFSKGDRYYNLIHRHNGEFRHWYGFNLPAVRESAWSAFVADRTSKLWFQLREETTGRRVQRTTIRSFEGLSQYFEQHPDFGGTILSNRRTRRQARRLTRGITDEEERMKILYNFVTSEVDCSNQLTLYSTFGARRTLSKRNGTSSECALLLVTFLRAANFEAYPVVVSTHQHGKVAWEVPRPAKFNHVIVLARIGDKDVVLEPLSTNIEPGYIQRHLDGTEGMIVGGPRASQRIRLANPGVYSVRWKADLELDSLGNIQGDLTAVYVHAPFIHSVELALRNRLRPETRDTSLQQRGTVETEEPDETSAIVNEINRLLGDRDYRISFVDISRNGSGGQAAFTLATTDPALIVANMLYISPFPFKIHEILRYSEQERGEVRYRIPADFEIFHVPEPKVIDLGDGQIRYTQSYDILENSEGLQLVLRWSLEVSPSEDFPDVNAEIPDGIREIQEAQNERVALRRLTKGAAP